MSNASKGSFYANNATVGTDTNPAGPADTPVAASSTKAASSFYKGTGTNNPPFTYIPSIIAFQAVSHSFLTGVNDDGTWTFAQPTFADISGSISSAQIPNGTVSFGSLSGTISSSQILSGTVSFATLAGQLAASQVPASIGPFIDVTKSPYTADPTGVTDSTTTIQAALTAAFTAGGGIVWLPVGTYLISGTLTIDGGVRLVGTGSVTTIINGTAYNGNTVVVNNSGAAHAGIEDIQIEGFNNTAATVDCVTVANGAAPRMSNCIFKWGRYALNTGAVDGYYDGIDMRGYTANCFMVGASWFRRCKFDFSAASQTYGVIINTPYVGSTSGENFFEHCDHGGGVTGSILIQGSSANYTHYDSCVIAKAISITGGLFVGFNNCEFGNTSFVCGATNVTVVNSIFSAATTISGSAVKTVANVNCVNDLSAANTLRGNNTGAVAAAIDLTSAQVAVLLTAAYSRTASGTVAPTGTAVLVGTHVMMGIAFTFTPKSTGNFIFYMQGTGANSVAGSGFNARMRFGTGTPPVNGATETGTLAGASSAGDVPTANGNENCNSFAIVSGLVAGTTYWLDVALGARVSGTASLGAVQLLAFEI